MEHSKSKQTAKSNTLTLILLFIYLIALIWIILFKFSTSIHNLPQLRSINLIPYGDSLIVNNKLSYSELLLNMMVFLPFGVYLSMLKPDWQFWKCACPAICVSLLFEIIQYIFAIGASDITDLINNSLGGILGCILYHLCTKSFHEHTNRILNILASIGTIGFILLFGIVIVSNL